MRIGIVAPSAPFTRDDAARVTALAAEVAPDAELVFHDQCFAVAGHFAGPDALRREALIAIANDPAIDALWSARGGYGAGRIADAAVAAFTPRALAKPFLTYSDGGNLLGALDRAGATAHAHGPVAADIRRAGGEAAVTRALRWLTSRDPATLEPGLGAARSVAFNLVTLSTMIGTSRMPDLTGRVLLVEETCEHLYAIDRALRHVLSAKPGLAGLRMGRFGEVPDNDRPFGVDAVTLVRDACADHAIPYLGSADIGHDRANRIVPFA